MVPVRALVDGLFTIEKDPNMYHSRCFCLANGIVQAEADNKFHVWVLNMSKKPKTLLRHTRIDIITTTHPVIYEEKYINEGADHQEKENVEKNPLDVKTENPINVDTLATRKGIYKRNRSKSLNSDVDNHYNNREKNDKDDKTHWKDRLSVGKPLEKYNTQCSRGWKSLVSCGMETLELLELRNTESN